MNRKPLFHLLLIILISGLIISSGKSRTTATTNEELRIGIYADQGVGLYPGNEIEYTSVLATILGAMEPDSTIKLIVAKDIEEGVLDELDVVIFPGGSGGGQSESLNENGRNKVQDFVEKGGGYVGICAGAYIGQSYDFNSPGYSLKLVNASVHNYGQFWDRGEGIIKVRITGAGKRLFPELQRQNFVYMYYANGPIVVPFNGDKKDYVELMKFESNVYHGNPGGKGDTPGKTFLLKAKKGKGVVVLMSGHPEGTPGLRWMLPRMVRIAGRKKLISYPKRFVNVNKFSREVMFDDSWRSQEKKFLEIILNNKFENTAIRLNTIEKLKAMKSIQLPDRISTILFDNPTLIKRKAAEILVFYDYFADLPELKKALKMEKNSKTKSVFLKAVKYLSSDTPKKEIRETQKVTRE